LVTVNCENQQEIDEYWARLSEGGSEGACGWLMDRYGLSWQVVPTGLEEMM
jgi:predicted 3-demethylubiquinone-9 3-methyltransferase (glyoxalase superfamily)